MIERLRQHPFLLAYWLAAGNSLRKTPRTWLLVAGGLIALTATALAIRYTLAPIPLHAEQYAVWVAVLAALHATAVVANGRRLAITDLTQSWLAATPLAAATLPLTVKLRALWPLGWQTSLYVPLILAALTVGVINMAIAGRLLLLALIGAGVGAGIGWYLGRPRARAASAALKSLVVPRAERAVPIRASLQALSRWLVAQVLEWANPKALRWPFIWASLTVPIGASAIEGLLVISFWALLFYMIVLLVGVARVARDAGRWLRTTPLSLWRFTYGLLRRALLHQFVATVVMSVVLLFAYGLEGTFWTVYVWIAVLFAVFSITAVAGRAARDVRLPLASAVTAVLAVAAVAPILAAPAAIASGAWFWWRGLEA